MIEKVLERINLLLKKANFETLSLDNFSNKITKFCFDILVKKQDSIFSIKVFPNIDNLNQDVLRDMKSLSLLLKSKPLLIGIRNRYQKLEDNTIYVREDLPFITVNTLENILNNRYPSVLAKRGGGIMFLDGVLVKELRAKHDISRQELADKIGVTKRTICSYENENMHPSEKVAQKILKIFEDNSIFKQINVLEWNFKINREIMTSSEESELSPFEAHIYEVIKDIGISSYWYKKGPLPFKFSIYSENMEFKNKNDFYPLFSGVSDEKKKINQLNIKCLKTFNSLFNKQALFIINNDIKIPDSEKDKIPIVKIKELEKIDDEDQFIELIQESK
ncbi:MAG: helix-turn-helix domain-containing protein [Promethearchaeota archaeon]|nr:MAG: helix-turn-helix domain-containing protein [Candidatus Lokiarchaeota archaeon]